jgi:hypothetical protein
LTNESVICLTSSRLSSMLRGPCWIVTMGMSTPGVSLFR